MERWIPSSAPNSKIIMDFSVLLFVTFRKIIASCQLNCVFYVLICRYFVTSFIDVENVYVFVILFSF